MLNIREVEELVKIVTAAAKRMDEERYADYDILGVEWDDETDAWEVTFYTDYDSQPIVIHRVKKTKNGYVQVGRSYD